jgi:prolyl oligopeptidase
MSSIKVLGSKMLRSVGAGATCLCAYLTLTAASAAGAQSGDPDDPYLWLEEVTGEKALAWVREQNAVSTRELEASPDFEPTRKRLLSILDSKEKIPYVSKHGAY